MTQIPEHATTSSGDLAPEPRTAGERVFLELQRLARAEGRSSGRPAATQDYVTRHILESFLDRLRATGHANDFVLKGGLLLGAYDIRRPTKDVDSNAISATVGEQWLTRVVRDVAQCDADDGVMFDAEAVRIETIREDAGYSGVRLRMPATVGPARGELVWDVSTGDPIVPAPQLVQLPRVLGDPISVWSYAPETTVAEKAVTILERGITSTRWRDYVDIVQLHRQGLINRGVLRDAVRVVAGYRGVALRNLREVIAGYGSLSQAKWAAWRRKNNLEDVCEELLDDQMNLIVDLLSPVLDGD